MMISKKFVKHCCSLVLGLLFLSSSVFASEPVDINKANAAALANALVGVGEAKAAEIIRYREAHGPFQSKEQLAEVKGIGDVLVRRNLAKIKLSSEENN